MLASAGSGWHIETAVHIIRIILGGVFDRYPKLQIVIGHLGEGLSFMFQRLDVMPREMTTLDRPISAYLRDNVHYTFSGFNFPAAFLDLLLELGGVNRIMFSADHPYGAGARFPGATPGQRRRQGTHRPQQCRAAIQAIGQVERSETRRKRTKTLQTMGFVSNPSGGEILKPNTNHEFCIERGKFLARRPWECRAAPQSAWGDRFRRKRWPALALFDLDIEHKL